MAQPDHSPWYQPRGPEIIMRGGEGFANSIGQGISKLGEGIGAWLEKRSADAKAEIAEGKAAMATFKASPELQKRIGKTPEELGRLAPRDQAAEVFGAFKAAGFESGQAAAREEIATALAKRKAMEDENTANAGMETALKRASTPGTFSMPNNTLPGVFPDTTATAYPDLEHTIMQTPGAGRSRLGAALLERSAQNRGMLERELAQRGGGTLPPGFKPISATQDEQGRVRTQFGPPQPEASKVPDGFVALGASVDDDGKVSVRYGPSPEDKTKMPTAADQAFFSNAQELQAKLDDLEATVKKHGNWESAMGDPESQAKLLQYPYAIAINYAKVVDPNSVAREGEVAAAQKYMIPMGFWTRNDLSKAAIKTMRAELTRRVKSYDTSQSPTAIKDAAAAAPNRFDSEDAARSSGAKSGDVIEVYDPATAKYRKGRLD